MQPRVVARLTKSDAAYLAGLIDGEGTIALSWRHAHDNRQLVVTISSTERVLVDKALRARLVLDQYVKLTPRNGKYDPPTRNARLEFESQFEATSIRKVMPRLSEMAPSTV